MQTLSSTSPFGTSAFQRASSFGARPASQAPTDAGPGAMPVAAELMARQKTEVVSLSLEPPKLAPAPQNPTSSRFRVIDSGDAPKSKAAHTHVFVYGSLLPGLHNNSLLRHSKLVDYCKTEPKFEMFSLGAYPAVCSEGITAISGALYRVDASTLESLDRLESHPHWYKREIVQLTSSHSAWMYVMPRHEPEIASGWADRVDDGNWYTFVERRDANSQQRRLSNCFPGDLHTSDSLRDSSLTV